MDVFTSRFLEAQGPTLPALFFLVVAFWYALLPSTVINFNKLLSDDFWYALLPSTVINFNKLSGQVPRAHVAHHQ